MNEKNIYQLYKHRMYNEDTGWYDTYGIRDRDYTIEINDVTSDLLTALKILTMLNSCKVSRIHLLDVIIDFLD